MLKELSGYSIKMFASEMKFTLSEIKKNAQGIIEALPNTQKLTQGGCQNKETKNHGPNEKTDQNSRKRTNKMEISNLPDAEFKTLV